MKLLDFLWQINKEVPSGEAGPEVYKTQKVSPSNVLQWANENKADLKGGAWAGKLIQQMHKTLLDKTNVDKQIKLMIEPTAGYAVLYNSEEAYAEAMHRSEETVPALHYIDTFRDAFKNLCGFALSAQKWAYPGCKCYYMLTKQDASDFLTKDFLNKHVSTTDDSKSARKVAQVRGVPVAERQGIGVFGSIVTSRSGGIAKGSLGDLKAEMKSRQAEFSATYAALSEHYADNFVGVTPPKKKFALIDEVTFITQTKYPMHEFDKGKGGEGDYYIHFGVSCSEDGKSWAVHHLARTADNRTPHGSSLNGLGIDAADSGTSAELP
jgi:hypothetical protein